jgi:hypothetical protein
MKRLLLGFLLLTQTAFAQDIAQRVADDAVVFDRVAQASKRDLPRDLLKRIIDEDIELLRGKRADGTYQYATFERFDSGRIASDFSIEAHADKLETVQLKGEWVYRVLLEVPSRKLLVRRNRPVWVERVEFDYMPERGSQAARGSVDVKLWLQPGEFHPVDLPAVARQATVRVLARAEDKGGYGNLEVALVKARIVDNADSPYANAVVNAKAVQRALDNGDIPSIRATAQRLRSALGAGTMTVVAAKPAAAEESPELRDELQAIEDLLTGSEQERREGMDRLHQMLRRMRQ